MKSPGTVGIDSDIFIHAYGQTKPGQDEICLRAQRLLDWFFEEKVTVYVSVVTVAEFLVKVPQGSHPRTVQKIGERFRIAPFNLRAASLAADLVSKSKEHPGIVRVQGDRPYLMADIKIVSSLLATNVVREVYSNDERLISIVNSVTSAAAKKLPVDPISLLQLQDELGNEPSPDRFDLH